MSFSKVKQTLEFAVKNKYANFYTKKYTKLPFDIFNITLENFRSIPFLTREEIVKSPPLLRIFTPTNEVGYWFTSSGTTNNPLLIPVAKLKQDYLDLLAQKLAKNKVEKIMLLKPQGYTGLRIFDWGSHEKLSKYSLILGDLRNLDASAAMAAALAIDGLETTPSGLNFFMPFLKEKYDLSKIKYIILGGEFTSEQKLRFFKSYFKGAYFDFTFGGAETRGKKGLRCDFLNKKFAPRFFHPRSDFFYFEVVDEEGKAVGDGEKGELILTTLFRTPFPLIRYKTGDLVTMSPYKCQCGRSGLMEVFGRIGADSLRIGGVTIYRHLVDEAIEKALGRFSGDWEMHVYELIHNKRLMPKIVLKLSNLRSKNESKLALAISNELKMAPAKTFTDLKKEELFLPLEVEFVDSFGQKAKEIKIISHLR